MDKQTVHKAIAECRQQLNSGNFKAGVFGLQIIEIMLTEAGCKAEAGIHIIQMDGVEMPDPFNSVIKKFKEQIEQMQLHKSETCPRCGNEEFSPGGKFCKICGLPRFMAQKGV